MVRCHIEQRVRGKEKPGRLSDLGTIVCSLLGLSIGRAVEYAVIPNSVSGQPTPSSCQTSAHQTWTSHRVAGRVSPRHPLFSTLKPREAIVHLKQRRAHTYTARLLAAILHQYIAGTMIAARCTSLTPQVMLLTQWESTGPIVRTIRCPIQASECSPEIVMVEASERVCEAIVVSNLSPGSRAQP